MTTASIFISNSFGTAPPPIVQPDEVVERAARWHPPLVRPYNEESYWHGQRALCRCGAVISWDADIDRWWLPYEFGNPRPDSFACPDGQPHIPALESKMRP